MNIFDLINVNRYACPGCKRNNQIIQGKRLLLKGIGDEDIKCPKCGNVWNTIEILFKSQK